MARQREQSGDETTRERWRRRIEAQAASGRTQAEFCRQRGLQLWRFRTWKYDRLRARAVDPVVAGVPSEDAPLFLPVEVIPEGAEVGGSWADPGVEIAVGGAVVRVARGFDGETLGRVMAVLGGREC